MDQLTALLDGPRARGAFMLRIVMNPPWAMQIEDHSPLTVVAVTRGHASIVKNGVAHDVPCGAVAIVNGTDAYVLGDDPTTDPLIRIHPGQVCTTLRGDPLPMSMQLGVRTWGDSSPDSHTVMLVGTYEHTSTLSNELLESLPEVVVVAAQVDSTLVDLLGREIESDAPGQQTFLDRLLDLITINTMRTWFQQNVLVAPPWWQAHRDQTVGQVLRLVHDNPAHPWTIAELASSAGVSRANLARRFTDLMGEPPMTYLTKWRLSLAADLLADPNRSVAAVAQQVGYSSPFALSTAYKRRFGLSPHQHRTSRRPPSLTR
jgi:AraC-like DNA-binding protein